MEFNLPDVLRQHRAFTCYLNHLIIVREDKAEMPGVTSINSEIAKVEYIIKDLEILIERLSKGE